MNGAAPARTAVRIFMAFLSAWCVVRLAISRGQTVSTFAGPLPNSTVSFPAVFPAGIQIENASSAWYYSGSRDTEDALFALSFPVREQYEKNFQAAAQATRARIRRDRAKAPHSLREVFTVVANRLFQHSLTANEVWRVAGVRDCAIRVAFTHATGVPLGRYIAAARIEVADVLLAVTDLDLGSISLKLGYTYHPTFTEKLQTLEGAAAVQGGARSAQASLDRPRDVTPSRARPCSRRPRSSAMSKSCYGSIPRPPSTFGSEPAPTPSRRSWSTAPTTTS